MGKVAQAVAVIEHGAAAGLGGVRAPSYAAMAVMAPPPGTDRFGWAMRLPAVVPAAALASRDVVEHGAAAGSACVKPRRRRKR